MQPVLSMVLTVPGNATSGNTHHHLLVMLTVAAGWPASNHPFFTASLSGKFWWGAKCLIKGEIKLLKSGHDSFHTPCSNLFIICQEMCLLLTRSPEGHLQFCVQLHHHRTLPDGLTMYTNNYVDFPGAYIQLFTCHTYHYILRMDGSKHRTFIQETTVDVLFESTKISTDLLWVTSRC